MIPNYPVDSRCEYINKKISRLQKDIETETFNNMYYYTCDIKPCKSVKVPTLDYRQHDLEFHNKCWKCCNIL